MTARRGPPHPQQNASETKQANITPVKKDVHNQCGDSEPRRKETIEVLRPATRQQTRKGRQTTNGLLKIQLRRGLSLTGPKVALSECVPMGTKVKSKQVQTLLSDSGRSRGADQVESMDVDLLVEELRKTKIELHETQQRLADKTMELQAALSFLNHIDTLSGGDVIEIARSLNADIFQVAAHIVDELTLPELTIQEPQGSGYGEALKQAYMTLGHDLANALRVEAERGFNRITVQVSLQVCLVTFCTNVINRWTPEAHESIVWEDIYKRVLAKENQAISGHWRSITRGVISDRDPYDLLVAINHTLIDILVVSGLQAADTANGSRIHFEIFQGGLERIVTGALTLKTAVNEITSMDIIPLIVSSGSPFDHTWMDDLESGFNLKPTELVEGNGGGEAEEVALQELAIDDELVAKNCRVLCTVELGLQRTVKGPKGIFRDTVLKPKVYIRG